MRSKIAILLMVSLSAVSVPGRAKDVPLVLRFDGDLPQAVVIFESIGSRTEPVDPQRKSVATSIKIETEAPETHSMSINYAGFHYPVDLRVHQFLPRVEFAVSMKPTESCTSQRVDALERSVTDFEEALRDSIEAMQLMAIEGNDRCLKSLRKRAAKVAFDKNVRANQLSKGLVAINDALATAYEHEFQSSSVVSGQIATYRKQSIGLEAVELVAVRDEAQGRGDFATAASVQEVIAERAASDESVAEAYAAEKMGDKEIKDDSEFLESLAPETPKPEPF